jgi:type II secretory pathway pseudopilin PulG
MNRKRGMTLLEVLVFIVVISITVTGSILGFRVVLSNSNNPGQILQATQLGNARMMIILQQRLVNGFTNITDPCTSGSPPTACSGLITFATTNSFVVTSSIPAAVGRVRTATITVSPGNVTLVMRFVQ